MFLSFSNLLHLCPPCIFILKITYLSYCNLYINDDKLNFKPCQTKAVLTRASVQVLPGQSEHQRFHIFICFCFVFVFVFDRSDCSRCGKIIDSSGCSRFCPKQKLSGDKNSSYWTVRMRGKIYDIPFFFFFFDKLIKYQISIKSNVSAKTFTKRYN